MTCVATHRLPVLYLTADLLQAWQFKQEFGQELDVQVTTSPARALAACAEPAGFVAVVVAADPGSDCGRPLARVLRRPGAAAVPVGWWLPARTTPPLLQALRAAGSPAFVQHADNTRLLTWLYALGRPAPLAAPALPLRKRLLDVLGAGAALLLLSPVLLLLALLIKLESRGPLFCYSYRVGAGYRAFKRWKLRSAHAGPGAQLADFNNLHHYQRRRPALPATSPGPAFIKLVNDPALTYIGRFLRRTRLDELPLLFNLLRGDVSLVGHRPLPFCEAQQLLATEYSVRFSAPAGLTGPWQVGDWPGRGGQRLGSDYLRRFSLRQDLRIILKTIPALFQQETT